ncbi:MAG TPA: hypothetical protein VNO26_02045 [Candidatus Limnocylindria bacterium]|nr:hypothetical protein [Candidatus Limnocylindria bacterium]
MPIDWNRVVFTEHMTEAAAVEGRCQVVFDFGSERACYEMTVLRALVGAAGQPFFAYGRNLDDPGGYRPVGEGASPEEALQECLAEAGLYHRRRVKQATT